MADKNNSFEGASLTTADGTPNPLLKAAVESANDAIIITEAELEEPGPRIEYVNPAFARMTGYEAADVVGRSPRLLQGPRTDRGLLSRLRDDLRHSRSFHGETINYRKDGSEYFVEWRITPLFGDDGRVAKWVAIQRDVSERVRAEQEREQLLERERAAREAAERQSRMKDEFLATLSHELRTPLNAIVGWSQILAGPTITMEDVREGVSVIGRNARAQTRLIEDLLDMSRIITGKIRLEVGRVAPAAVVEAAIAAVRHAADAKGVRLDLAVDPLAGPVSGDASRLQQVLWNLLSNAVRFTPAGGTVRVAVERASGEVELTVSDTGAGIPPAFLPHVFDRFSQADGSTARQHGGLGIGLAIVRHLVELHGGRVRAKSGGEGQGATFVVSLPAAAADAGPAPTDRPGAGRAAAAGVVDVVDGPSQLTGLRVLVVDDEPDSREMMRRVLAARGATVETSASAEQTLHRLDEDGPPDVLVSDIGMPAMDGYELIRRVRQRPAAAGGTVPAAAVTAYVRTEDRRLSLVAGFDMHLSKPIDTAELVAVVARLATRKA